MFREKIQSSKSSYIIWSRNFRTRIFSFHSHWNIKFLWMLKFRIIKKCFSVFSQTKRLKTLMNKNCHHYFSIILQWLFSVFLPFWTAVGKAAFEVKPVRTRNQRTEVISRETQRAVLLATKTILVVCPILFKAGYKTVYLRNINQDSLEVCPFSILFILNPINPSITRSINQSIE